MNQMKNKLSKSKNIINKRVMYVVPIPSEYIELWIWYKIDYDILNDLGYEVFLCQNFKDILLNINKAKIIYGWWWSRMAIFILFCKLLKKKLIITGAIHMFDLIGIDDFWRFNFIKKFLTKISLRFADANIFMSKDQYQSITNHIRTFNPKLVYSCSQNKIEQLNILKEKKLNWIENNFNKKDGYAKDLTICTMCWQTKESQVRKGLIILLQSYLVLKKLNLTLPKLTIMGKEGNGLKSLKEFISKNNLNNHIKLEINISVERKNKVLSASNFYVQSSWYEGFGNAVLEAMEQGTPALVSRYSAQPEVVGKIGIINLEQTPESLADELNKLSRIKKNQYIEMVEKGFKRIEDLFSYEKRREKFKEIFDNI